MPSDGAARRDLIQRFPPPGQANLLRQRLAGNCRHPRQLVVERIERDEITARAGVADETAGEPPIGIGAPNRLVEIVRNARSLPDQRLLHGHGHQHRDREQRVDS